MTDIVQALATLDSDPTQAQARDKVSTQAKAAAQSSSELAAAAKTAVREAQKRYRERGDAELWLVLCDVLMESGLLATASERAELLIEKGRVCCDELLSESQAEAAYQAALALDPENETAQDALEQLQAVKGNWQKVVQKWLDEAKRSTERQLTTDLYTRIGEYYGKYYQDTSDAERYWYKALSVEPRNRRSSLHLERLFRAAQKWPELIKTYEQRAESAATKEDRVLALLSLADLYGKQLRNHDAADESH